VAVAAGRRPPGGAAGSAPVGGHPQPDAPGALADVELAEAARPELGDERREELVREAVDRRVIGSPLVGRPHVGRRTGDGPHRDRPRGCDRRLARASRPIGVVRHS
jgi:hypothetical protein